MCDYPHFANGDNKQINFTQFLKVHSKKGMFGLLVARLSYLPVF